VGRGVQAGLDLKSFSIVGRSLGSVIAALIPSVNHIAGWGSGVNGVPLRLMDITHAKFFARVEQKTSFSPDRKFGTEFLNIVEKLFIPRLGRINKL